MPLLMILKPISSAVRMTATRSRIIPRIASRRWYTLDPPTNAANKIPSSHHHQSNYQLLDHSGVAIFAIATCCGLGASIITFVEGFSRTSNKRRLGNDNSKDN